MRWDERERSGRGEPPGYLDPPNDYGQADYDTNFAYDAEARRGYRRDPFEGELEARREAEWRRTHARPPEPRSFREEHYGPRRKADLALWGAVTGRLAYDRRLDARDIHVTVEEGVVILDGVVRHRGDRERAEDLAEVRGAKYVRNNLRLRERRWF